MLPKFRAGDVLLVQPQSPLDTGNFVLVEIRTEDGEIEGYVRRYGGRTDKGIETEILSPPTVIFVPFEQIECVGRITVCREAK
jgi:phage repressor protein C with HTH and peptisase S24 domain